MGFQTPGGSLKAERLFVVAPQGIQVMPYRHIANTHRLTVPPGDLDRPSKNQQVCTRCG
jgi:hypothetical protein